MGWDVYIHFSVHGKQPGEELRLERKGLDRTTLDQAAPLRVLAHHLLMAIILGGHE